MHVAVIGGGIAGVAAAYQALRRGASVTVIDAGLPGAATRAAAGIAAPVPVTPAPPELNRLRVLAVGDFYPALLESLADDGITNPGVGRPGEVVVARDCGGVLDDLERRFNETSREYGTARTGQFGWLDGAQLRAMVPWAAPAVTRAAYLSGALQADGRRLHRSLVKAVMARGGRFIAGYGTPAVTGQRVTGVRVDGQVVGADAVILAAGAWADDERLHPDLRIPVRPERGQLVHLRAAAADRRTPIVATTDGDYAVGFPRGKIVVGATREPAVTAPHATAGGVGWVLHRAADVVAGLDSARFITVRVGLRPHSPDGAPVVGGDPRIAGAYHVQGLGSLGLTAGPYLAALGADAALGLQAADAQPFAPGRFLGVKAPVER